MENLTKQFVYNGQGYLDGKMLCANFAELINTASENYIKSTQRFVGLTVTLLKISDELPKQADVWLVTSTTDNSWKIKNIVPLAKKEDLDLIPFNLIAVGLEVIVLNGGDIKKYRATKKTSKTQTVEWTEINAGADIEISGNDVEE